jgi:hypothetical protein
MLVFAHDTLLIVSRAQRAFESDADLQGTFYFSMLGLTVTFLSLHLYGPGLLRVLAAAG